MAPGRPIVAHSARPGDGLTDLPATWQRDATVGTDPDVDDDCYAAEADLAWYNA